MSEQNYSDEVINAFVDDELTKAERLEILASAADSDQLRRKICEIQQLKEMVSSAYPEVRGRGESERNPMHGWVRYSAVATLGAVSLYLVLSANGQLVPQGGATPGKLTYTAEINEKAVSRVVFHVSSDDPATATEMLDEVEMVLNRYADQERPLRIEVVANNQGIRIFQQGRSTVSQRIAQMHQTYPNLVFAACGNTIERFQKQDSERISILPEAVIIRSGVSFVARRQQSGWSYIKV